MKEKKHLNALQTLNSIVLGINSILSQILFVKIWLSVFMGNEIALGIFFAFWAVFILAGSFTGRFFPERTKNRIFFVAVLNLIFILLLFAEFFLLYKIRASFIPGTMVDPVNMLIFGLMIFPSNFILGLTFTYLASFKNALTSEKIYFFESIGFLSAGLLYSFLMAVLFNNFQIFIILAFINIISSSLSFFNCIKKSSAFILLISFLFIFLIYRSDKIYKVIISKNIPGYELMQVKDSFYGSLWTVKKDDQYSILKNNLPVINSDNYPFSEEFIRWSLGFANNPREILIIGFQPDFFSEIDKFNVKTADIVETDREMINMMNKNFPEKYLQYLFNDKVIFHFTDPLYYIKTTSKKYDSVILNLPEITDISVNKLFT